jgi:hypothetical protein
VSIISKSAWASIASSARAKPSLTCCASPQNTMMDLAREVAADRCLERGDRFARGTTSRPAISPFEIERFLSFTAASSNHPTLCNLGHH